MWFFVFAVVGPVAANQLGWVAAEVGRQPWVVHPRVVRDAQGQVQYDAEGFVKYRRDEALRTDQAASEVVSSNEVLTSIAMFGVIYLLLLVLWVYVLNRKIQAGPQALTVANAGGGASAGIVGAVTDRLGHDRALTDTDSPADQDR